jgi:ABC-type Na+ efflux pump permease subunit
MKKILDVIRWEFVTHFRSRTFLFATLFSPILVTLIMLFPTLFIAEEAKMPRLSGSSILVTSIFPGNWRVS